MTVPVPRRRPTALVAVALVLLAGLAPAGGVSASPARNDPESRRPRRVLVVSLPRVTWERLGETRTPNLRRFLAGAAVGSTSTRTIGPRTEPGPAYATIGAGARTDTLDPVTDGESANRDEAVADGPAAAVYQRRTGVRPRGEVLDLTFAEQVARNESLLYGAVPGALGQALREAGIGTGVVGNADQSLVDPRFRQVALAAVDGDGQVAAGNVGPSLLASDDLAPFGLRDDTETYLNSVRAAWDRADVVVVEASDLERAEQARAESTQEQGDRQFRRALRRTDRLVGGLLDQVDLARDLVVVLGPTAPLEDEQLTVFGARGAGIGTGWARSASTRRAGFVTLTDIAPFLLDRLRVPVPDSMNDTPVTSVATTASLDERVDRMVRDNERARFRDDTTGPVTVAFIILLVVMLALVALAVSRLGPSWRPPLQVLALTVLAVPATVFLGGLLPYGPFVAATFGLAVLAGAVALALVARGLSAREVLTGPVLLTGLAVGVLAVDVLVGGPLQLNTMFGYSPIVAGRFAGFGNQAFSILTISSLVLATACWEIAERRRPDTPRWVRVAVLLGFFAVVIVVDGAPMWGSDVGGVLASVPAFAVCTLVLLERRIHVRVVAAIGAGTVVVLAAFAALDLSRPADSRTHLGRFAARVLDGDVGTVLERKLQANLNQLTSTVWTLVIPAALLFFAYLAWRPNHMLRRIEGRHPSFRAFEISGLTLGVVAWLLNDSGVAIPAMMLTIALPYTAYLVLDVLRREEPG